jgi:cell division protein FtsB
VDYDAIAMLNVSATQQLKREKDEAVKALWAENAELKAANDALTKRLQLLESKTETILNLAAAKSGSNGNGRH